MQPRDRELVVLARRQRQVFTRAQARAAGHNYSSITRRIKAGDFEVVGPQTLTFGGVSLDWRGKLQAGVLDLGPGTLVTAESAAAIHQLDGFGSGPLVFLTDRANRNRHPIGMVITTCSIKPNDGMRIDGLPVATGTRTIVDLLGRVDQRRLGNAYDSACRTRITAPELVDRRLDELGRQGRKGVADLEALRRAGHVQSWLERQYLDLSDDEGFVRPVVQRIYRRDGMHVARVDFDYSPLPIVIEVGGRRGYLSYDERRRQERRRNQLQLLGRTVYFFTTEDVTEDSGAYVRATLRQLLRAA